MGMDMRENRLQNPGASSPAPNQKHSIKMDNQMINIYAPKHALSKSQE
jgi:hypothetical protein